MPLNPAELAALTRLRERFLSGARAGSGYWRNEHDLALYDTYFAERIGWKWDAVILELAALDWQPRSRHVFDFGCGSGVAHRRVLERWPEMESLTLCDLSSLAVNFAERRVRAEHPKVNISTAPAGHPTLPPGSLLLVSHVINELSPESRSQLLGLARHADEIIWVEAGTHAGSRALIEVREELLQHFGVVAPCTHLAPCGLLAAENAPHWCHHFGRVPSAAFQDSNWAHLAKQIGIDLGTLPYSYLVLQRGYVPPAPTDTRLLGRPREEHGRMEILCCRATGVKEATLQKRDAGGLYKKLRKGTAPTRQSWQIEAGKILPSPEPSKDSESAPAA